MGKAKTIWTVLNRHTGKTSGTYQSVKSARRAVDREDNKYGGYAHEIRVKDSLDRYNPSKHGTSK
jgi:hypothetical protein